MTRSMLRGSTFALGVVLGLASAAIAVSPAAAQIAAALGKPLPSPDLPAGTIMVRVVAGSPASPVVGTDVTLIVNDTPRVARTDSAGRATFPGLPPGATAVAKVIDADKAEHASDPFPVPDSGGARVLLSTKPWNPGAGGGAPFAGGGAGGAGMPNPRQLSGEARPEQGDPSGMITVRVTYDDFKDTPEGVAVNLVGYRYDDSISLQTLKTDKAGRVQFTDLDRSGATSYFALAELPRNGAIDRLSSMVVLLDSQRGVRMVLSSEKRDSKAPPIDDLQKAERESQTPAGKVRVVLEGAAGPASVVTLIDAATRKVIAQGAPTQSAPDASRVQGGADFANDSQLPAGTLDVDIAGGPGQTEDPIPGAEVRVIPAAAEDAAGALASTTGADGKLRMALQVSGPQKAVVTINGASLTSRPFDLSKSGGKLVIRAHWEETGRLAALFDAPAAGQVVYAEATDLGKHYRSMPFQIADGMGSKVSVFVYPRIMYRFQMQSWVEDQSLAVQGRFEVLNYSWAPYRSSSDGMLIPLPKGFKGGIVYDPDQNEVAVAANEGFRIIRPIPPNGRQFHGGFTLQVDSGQIAWNLDLPIGTIESQLAVRKTPNMTFHLPPKVNSETRSFQQGTFEVIAPITILPNQSMAMSIEGLPSPPPWRRWVSGIVGLIVVAVMIGGLVFALIAKPSKPAADATDEAKRQKLLDQLVELERTGANPKRREQLLDELEKLWS